MPPSAGNAPAHDPDHPLLPIVRSANRTRVLIALAIVVAIIAALYAIRDVATPVLTALALAYILVPVVNLLERKLKIPRVLAVIALMISVALVAVGVIAVLVPALVAQLAALGAKLPTYIAQAITWIDNRFGLAIPTDAEQVLEQAKTYLRGLGPGTISRAGAWAATILAGGAGAITGIVSALLVPLFLFFFLKDWTMHTGRIMTLLPAPLQTPISAKLGQIDRTLSAYLRGVGTVATILAVIYSIALSALGVPLGLLIGVLAGYAYVVPFMSTVTGIVLGVLFCLLEFTGWGQIAGVIAVFVIGNAIEGLFLTPRIVGDSLGLSPMAVILAVMIGGNLFGFLGVLIALPCAAVIHVIGRDLVLAWRSSNTYKTGLVAPPEPR